MEMRRQQFQAPGCVEFKSKDSVLVRPGGSAGTQHGFSRSACPQARFFRALEFSVVWWDPRAAQPRRRGAPRHPPARTDRQGRRTGYRRIGSLPLTTPGATRRDQAIAAGTQTSVAVRTVTQMAKTAGDGVPDLKLPPVEIVKLPREVNRPSGPRFGALVHAVLASVPLDGDLAAIQRLATIHGRVLGAAAEEIAAASESVHAALAHAVFDGARRKRPGVVVKCRLRGAILKACSSRV